MKRFVYLLLALLLMVGPAFAGSVTTTGAGKKAAGGGGGSAATYVGSVGYHMGTTGTLPLPSGVASGDIVLVSVLEGTGSTGSVNSPGNASAAYTMLDRTAVSGIVFSLWARVLNANDISNGNLTYSGVSADSSTGLTAYRGATTFTLKPLVSNASTSTTAVVPGFAPSGSNKGTVFLAVENADTTPATLSTSPQTFTQRLADHSWVGMHYSMDKLSGYTNGNVNVSTFTSVTAIIVWPVELT